MCSRTRKATRRGSLVHGDGVPFALDVLDVLGRAEVLELLGAQHVAPGDDLAAVADRGDQASLTRSLIVAPVAYGVMVASLSRCASSSSCGTLSK